VRDEIEGKENENVLDEGKWKKKNGGVRLRVWLKLCINFTKIKVGALEYIFFLYE